MNDTLILLITIIISAGIGAFIGLKFSQLKSKSERSTLEERQLQLNNAINDLKQNIEKTESEREEIRREKDFLNTELSRRNTEFENLQQQNLKRDEELEKRQEQLRNEFKILANSILEEKSNKFTEENKKSIETILNPLKEKIQNFEKKVETSQKENYGLHESLKTQLKNLKELNQEITKEASNLTKALKGDSKVQGNWGEIVLTRILEQSGLEKDREYTIQDVHQNEEGKRFITDVLIHLPDGKKMIIDSKVSLVDFERYSSEEDEIQKQIHLKKHIQSIKNHVETLSSKQYQHLIDESPDTVFMFIPIEPAFAIASAYEPKIYEQAFNKQVVIVTPSMLLATLRIIDNLWQNDRQKQNALEIAKQAGRLYDQFVNLTNDMLKIGNQLNTVKGTYETSMKKLTGKGNLLTKVENIKKLGAKASKNLDEKLLKRSSEDIE